MWNRILQNTHLRKLYYQHLSDRNDKVGAFLHLRDPNRWPIDVVDQDVNVSAIPVAVKDNIAVAGEGLTCGSKMLAEFVGTYDATAVTRLQHAGAWIVGKTNMDEFGMGSSTENSALATTYNPWDSERVAGGSSGGSAAAVSAGMVPVALGSDTGGSIRQPAAFCGVYGLKPTYGTVSRYGLVAYASSLEVIGVLGESADSVEAIYNVIRGEDALDQTSVSPGLGDHRSREPVRTIGILTGDLGLDPGVDRNYRSFLASLEEVGYKTHPLQLKLQEYVSPAYYTIAMAEAAANLARYNGVRYGYRPVFAENPEELVRKARSEALGAEVKLRIVLGTYVLRSGFQDQYYLRAQKIRTLIRRELDAALQEVDLIAMPVFPTQPFRHGDAGMDAFQQKVADRFTATANLAGFPALTVPSGLEQGLPVGMQFMGPAFSETRLFEAARAMSAVHPLQRPPHYPGFSGDAL
jgi:aspartyl-tRNA(Asn)/glutamyl-tRNA(Gln) amidotransferase subunit A